MSIALPEGFHWDPDFKLGRESAALTARVWPNYLVEESDLPEPGLKFQISREEFARRFPAWGIRRGATGGLAAFANAVQLAVDFSSPTLPDEGWRYAIQSAGSAAKRNCLCLLVANVDPTLRGLGLATILIERAKLAARELGFRAMIAPVRPTLKHRMPFMSMEDYVCKRDEGGELYDPWIYTHVRAGAKIVNVCSESVEIRASLQKWREWTGLPLQTSGDRVLPGGLAPLVVDTHRNVGTYREPNVWMKYSV